MKTLILILLLGLQACTPVKGFLYWFEHSENMRMPVTDHQKETQICEQPIGTFSCGENNESKK